MKVFDKIIYVLITLLLLSSCGGNKQRTLTPLELQSLQRREFATSKKNAFTSTVTVLQDLGYTIGNADMDSGVISAVSTNENFGKGLFHRGIQYNYKVTAFVNSLSQNNSSVRLNFDFVYQDGGSFGGPAPSSPALMNTSSALSPELYQQAFEKISEAIFIRKNAYGK